MPVQDFDGNTFVSFVDISGFKEMMKNKEKAITVLNHFYNSGYRILNKWEYGDKISGIFVSDCGVLYAVSGSKVDKLKVLLEVIRELNKAMLDEDVMLTTSIAYGEFSYHDRIEIGSSIRKEPVYGYAYVDAYLDHEHGKPKIKPGQCRILKNGLPKGVKEAIERKNDEIFQLIKARKRDKSHYYFYWNCQNPSEIEVFERNYSNAEKLIYNMYLKALKGEYWIRD